jgi:lipopolysaccharide export LptBFGC system permease protein LptF
VELYGVNIFFDNDFLAPDSPSDFMNRLRVEKIRWSPQIARKSPGIKDLTSGPLVIETEVRRLKYLAAVESGSKAIPEALEDYAYAVTEFHRRLSLSLTALTFPLASFLIGLFLRSQNRLLPFFLSISVVPSVYFVFELLGNILASRGIYPWATEHIGNAMLLLVTGTIFVLTERGPR